jgi:hypothetical protein
MNLRSIQKKLSQVTNLSGLKFEKQAEPYIAKAQEIDILKVDPYLVQVRDGDYTSKIWSYALTNWSVPVSAGLRKTLAFFGFRQAKRKTNWRFRIVRPANRFGYPRQFYRLEQKTKTRTALQLSDCLHFGSSSALQQNSQLKISCFDNNVSRSS